MRGLILSLMLGMVLMCGCKTGKVCDARADMPDQCEIHHRIMRSEKFPNPHLTIAPSQAYIQARMRYFIHAKPTLYMLPDDCKTIMVYMCDDCVESERRWKLDHPGEAP